MIGRSKKFTFSYIKDRVWKKLNSLSGRFLSLAGREVLIKSVLQAIPSYCMSAFLLSTSPCEEIEIMLNSYWWGAKERDIRWMSWKKLARRKEEGGMGFRNLHAFNLAMLRKHGWKFISNPNVMVTRFIKAKYFPNCEFLDSNVGHNPSYVWHSIWSTRGLLDEGCRWCIGDGSKINLWQDP